MTGITPNIGSYGTPNSAGLRASTI